MKKIRIITNNPKICEKYNPLYKITFIEGTFIDVLITTRDFIHKGHELLTHPLSGSIKPNETPYKSLIISEAINKLNTQSLIIIEDAILTAKKFIEMKELPKWSQVVLEDFSEIDYRLLESALESIKI